MPLKFIWLLLVCFLLDNPLTAQTQDRCVWINNIEGPQLLDSLSVDVSSINFPGDTTIQFDYNYSDGTILLSGTTADSVEVCYRVFPFALHQSYYKRTLQQYDSSALFKTSSGSELWTDRREELFPTSQLYKSGSISRGISFGNNQDVFVNSNLNLQMEGKLTSDLNIRAVITDQNIPFQPEGNTKQVQYSDKVLLDLNN